MKFFSLTFLTSFFTKKTPVPVLTPLTQSTTHPILCGCDIEKYSVYVFDGGDYEHGVYMNLCATHIREACYNGKLVEFL